MRYKTTLASILFFIISFVSSAQGGPPPPQPPPVGPGVPVDGTFFIVLLLVVGLIYGSKKILSVQKK